MKRVKPDTVAEILWERFERWADNAGVGDHPDDWEDWWDCYWQGAQDSANLIVDTVKIG